MGGVALLGLLLPRLDGGRGAHAAAHLPPRRRAAPPPRHAAQRALRLQRAASPDARSLHGWRCEQVVPFAVALSVDPVREHFTAGYFGELADSLGGRPLRASFSAGSPRWSSSAVRWRGLTHAVVDLIRRHRLAARTLPLAGVWPHGLVTRVSATTPPATDFAQTTPHGALLSGALQLLLQLLARCASSAASRPLPPPADPRRGENVARRRGGGRCAR